MAKNGAPGLLHGIPINVRRKNTESESSTLGERWHKHSKGFQKFY